MMTSSVAETKSPVSAFDVAQYILNKRGPMTTMKLQKLIYYAQAWSLVWDGRPLFNEPIEAWERGPVVRDIFYAHQGERRIGALPQGNPDLLDPLAEDTVNAVLERYGQLQPEVLSELTHAEEPWRETYKKGNSHQIPMDLMSRYYTALLADLREEEVPERGSLFLLKSILATIDKSNQLEEISTGVPVGREVW